MTERTPEERLREANFCIWCPNPYEIVLKKMYLIQEKRRRVYIQYYQNMEIEKIKIENFSK